MNYTWKIQSITQQATEAANALAQEMGIHPVLGHLLLQRNIKTATEAKRFFHPVLSDLHNPFLMKDMDKAVMRLNEAIGMKERILIYGDYDVDGCTAVTLVYKFLHALYNNVEYYIPDRYDDGYGISNQNIDRAAAMGVKLIIILDCGIKSLNEISYAKELGIDFIVCDHHTPDDQLPDAYAVLDPKRADETYPYQDLCGCGVGFKFMQAFAIDNGLEFNRLTPYLELCAISIAADIVPIMGENRILAYHGLKQLNTAPSVALQAIMTTCGLEDKEITMNEIIFRIAPRINASGRIQNGSQTVSLLIEKDYQKALEKANIINSYNEARRDIDKQMTEEANAIVENIKNLEGKRAIVVYSETWHKGIIGIVAARLTELYHRPTVVLAIEDGVASASARSTGGFDIYSAIQDCKDLLQNFGGHTFAVGFTISSENIKAFAQRFENYVEEHILPEQIEPTLHIEHMLSFKDISRKFYSDLKKFRPFGPLNPKPLFATTDVYDYGTSKVVGRDREHIKLELVTGESSNIMSGIAFQQSSGIRFIKSRRAFNICYTIEDNIYKPREAQLQIEDIKPANQPD